MQPIIQHLFQESSLEAVSRERLESFVAEYPSFGIGHYLLSRKLQAEGDDRFAEKTQLTNLYFSNPFWLQWLLESSDSVVREPAPTAWHAPEETTPAVYEPEEPVIVPEPETVPAEAPIVKDTMESVVEQSLMEASQPAEQEPVSMVELAESVAAAEEPSAAELLLESIEEAKNLRDNLHKIKDDFGTGRPLPEEPAAEAPIKDEEAPFVLDEVDTAVQQAAAEFPAGAEAGSEPVVAAAAATIGAEEPEQKTVVAEQGFVFEPYHTIDYFASQGIKLKLDDNPSDQLGKQLKSFTDWLKVMRKLPQKEREIISDRVTEETIQTIAAHSVVGREIVTETMAEVLAKQGMPERARAVYEKLSLLNPDKRAYFATKIEQLNIQ